MKEQHRRRRRPTGGGMGCAREEERKEREEDGGAKMSKIAKKSIFSQTLWQIKSATDIVANDKSTSKMGQTIKFP